MRKTFFTHLFFCFLFTGFVITTLAQKKGADTVPNKAAKSSMFETWKPIQYNSGGGTIFTDDMNGVNDVAGLAARGWFFDDVDGAGLSTTFQGNTGVFLAYEGPDTGYVAQNFNGAFGGGLLIDQWLISPEVTVGAGDVLQFWHRSPDGNPFPDPLEVWVSSTAGTTAADFDVQLDAFQASIAGWAQWVGTFPSGGTVRFAVRYYTTDGGPAGNESNFVGLDLFEVMPPCLIDQATNPGPVDGAADVDVNLAAISWINGAGANNIEVWFDGALVYDGIATTSWKIPGPLSYSTTYPWQIIGKNDSCAVPGPSWAFTTGADPNIVCAFMDDFNGTTNWSAVTLNDPCDWAYSATADIPGSWGAPPSFPATADSFYIFASSDFCGAVMNAYLTGNFTVDASLYQNVWIEFDSDMEVFGTPVPADTGAVDVSIDGGATWTRVFNRDADTPGEHAVVDISGLAGLQGNIQFRLCYYGDFSWHWALDNFAVYLDGFVPVELTSFTASTSNESVNLNWSTATETNNQGFEVQRSINNSEFVVTAFIDGKGTTTEVNNYSYTDVDLQVGTYSYRLKQVDYDGSFEFSKVIEVEIIAPDVFALEQNYPNPFNPSTKIKFSLAADSKVSLTVFDVLGQEVANLISGNLPAGSHEFIFNASNINSGVYFYRIDATGVDGTNFSSIKKMILMK